MDCIRSLVCLCLMAVVASVPVRFEFKRLIEQKVLPTFNLAVLTYRGNILERLAGLTPAVINAQSHVIVKQLNCDVDKMNRDVRASERGAGEIKTMMDGRLRVAVGQEKALIAQNRALQQQHAGYVAKLGNYQRELASTKRKVANAQRDASAAEARLQQQHKKYNDAKNSCIGKRRRRRKRFLGGLKKIVKNVIIRPVKTVLKPAEKLACRVLNRGGIKNAEHARNLARQNLNNQRSRVANLQNEVNKASQKVRSTNANINTVKRQLTAKRVEVAKRTKAREDIGVVSTKAKLLHTNVGVFEGRTKVFKDAVKKMIDFNQVIGPITSIKEHLAAKFGVNAIGVSIDTSTMQKITANLKKLEEKLPNFPFVENVTGCT